MTSPTVGYSIDRSGRLARVNRAWDDFALRSSAPELVGRQPLGTLLLDHISDKTTRLIYRYLFARVRQTGRPATFRCRCDSPDARRLMELSVYIGEDSLLEVRVQTIREVPRPTVAILEHGQRRSADRVTVCSWCNRMEAWPGHWVAVEDAIAHLDLLGHDPLPAIMHGSCHDCANVMLTVATDPELAASGHVVLGGDL
jgi:hypothetical protein